MKKNFSTHVSYKLLDKNNKVILDKNNEICFAEVTYKNLSSSVKKMVVYHADERTYYTEDLCKKWIDLLKEFGFEIEYEGFGTGKYETDKDEHVISIPLTGKNKYRSYLHSILMLVRLLTEEGLYTIPEIYWKEEKKYNPKDTDERFQLMQYAYKFIKANSNHQIRTGEVMSLLTLEEFIGRANELKTTISQDVRISVHKLWAGSLVSRNHDFNSLKNKKDLVVYVVGGNTNYVNWFPMPISITHKLKEADLVVFTGGEDVDPSMYDHPTGSWTRSNIKRDLAEKKEFEKAKELGIPMLGICRGLNY